MTFKQKIAAFLYRLAELLSPDFVKSKILLPATIIEQPIVVQSATLQQVLEAEKIKLDHDMLLGKALTEKMKVQSNLNKETTNKLKLATGFEKK